MAQAHKRLQRELQALQKESPPGIHAIPLESDILQWHYVIEGPPGTAYAGGFYHGLVRFPSEYPFKPPSVMVYTPSGRFATNTRICLSMSDFHPETWVPAWSVASILNGVLSFMLEATPTVGSIETSEAERKRLALASHAFNRKSPIFCELFPELIMHPSEHDEAPEMDQVVEASPAGHLGGMQLLMVGASALVILAVAFLAQRL